MMNDIIKRLPMLLLLLATLAYAGSVVATQSLTGFTQLIGISSDANTVQTSGVDSSVKLYGSDNMVQESTYATWSQSNTVASTSAVTATALTGRDLIEIRSGPTAGEEIWVGIGLTPAVASGIMVTPSQPFIGRVPAGTAVKTIASGGWTMSITQAAY